MRGALEEESFSRQALEKELCALEEGLTGALQGGTSLTLNLSVRHNP